MTVIDFPADETPELLIGPFTSYRVIVDGRVIPRLTGAPVGDGIELVVDGRFGATFPKEHAHQAAWLIAQAMAIGAGYSHLGAPNRDSPFAPQAARIEVVPDDSPAKP